MKKKLIPGLNKIQQETFAQPDAPFNHSLTKTGNVCQISINSILQKAISGNFTTVHTLPKEYWPNATVLTMLHNPSGIMQITSHGEVQFSVDVPASWQVIAFVTYICGDIISQ